MNTFYIENTGTCVRVKVFGEEVRQLFLTNNFKEDSILNSNYILLNTCSFLESKSRFFLSRLNEIVKNKKAFQSIVVIGCLGATHKKEIKEISSEIIILGRDLSEISNTFGFHVKLKSAIVSIPKDKSKNLSLLSSLNRHVIKNKNLYYRLNKDKVCYIQISTGCNGKCSYCSEKYTTKLKSHPINEILDTINEGIAKGYKLFSLSSDDASAYGTDIGSSLMLLLKEIVKLPEGIQFIIPEFNPQGLSDEVIELLKDPKFFYITIPIQSGSQRILIDMKRPYSISVVMEKIKQIKKKNPNLFINTHIIVGYPGETDKDFKKTINVIKSGYFDRVKIFCYSKRPHTYVSGTPVPYDVIEQRRKIALRTILYQNLKKLSISNVILNFDQIKE